MKPRGGIPYAVRNVRVNGKEGMRERTRKWIRENERDKRKGERED